MTHKRRGKRPLSKRNSSSQNKDQFMDLAQAALEEADEEEEKRGLIGEVVEALIVNTGAPLVAEVISEQLRSQDIIERAAEMHEERKRLSPSPSLTEIESLKEPISDEEKEDTVKKRDTTDQPLMITEYSWRLFRLLLLASIVGLTCHFINVHRYPFFM